MARRVLVAALGAVWAFRLAAHVWIHRVLRETEEDGRYAAMREHWGDKEMDAWAKQGPREKAFVEFDASKWGEPDLMIENGASFPLGEYTFLAIHSPGHSPGSICYRIGEVLFTGDLLFQSRPGRVDLLNSSAEDLVASLRHLYDTLPDGTVVYPGHGEATAIGAEKENGTGTGVQKEAP